MSSLSAASGRDGANSRVARGTDSVDGNVRATLGPAPGPQLVRSCTLSTRALARCSRGNDRYASASTIVCQETSESLWPGSWGVSCEPLTRMTEDR